MAESPVGYLPELPLTWNVRRSQRHKTEILERRSGSEQRRGVFPTTGYGRWVADPTPLNQIDREELYAFLNRRRGSLQSFYSFNPDPMPYTLAACGTAAAQTSIVIPFRDSTVTDVRVAGVSKGFTVQPRVGAAGIVTTAGTGAAVAVDGSYAYCTISNTSKLQVIDISEPANPTILSTTAIGATPNGIVVRYPYVFIVCNTGNVFQIWNISNPAAPTLTGSVATANAPFGVAVRGNYAYVTSGTGASLQVINITTPATPVVSGTVALGGSAYGVALMSGNYVCCGVYGANAVKVVDVTNPAAPAVAGSVGLTGAYGVAIVGTYAIVTSYATNTLNVVNVSVPATPVLLANYLSTDAGPTTIAVSGTIACVVARSGTVSTFNVSDPTRLAFVGKVASAIYTNGTGAPDGLAVDARYAYVTSTNPVFQVLDISRPEVIQGIGGEDRITFTDGALTGAVTATLTGRARGVFRSENDEFEMGFVKVRDVYGVIPIALKQVG